MDLDRLVAQRAGHRCEYCRAPQVLSNARFHVEHIIPRRAAPHLQHQPDNLALACISCNLHKGARISATDPTPGETCPIFNPRLELWPDHFRLDWRRDGVYVDGLTPTGRATAAALRMNGSRQRRARAYWLLTGEFP